MRYGILSPAGITRKGFEMHRRLIALATCVALAALTAGVASATAWRDVSGASRSPLVYRVASGRAASHLLLRLEGRALVLRDGGRIVRVKPLAETSGVRVFGASGRTRDTLTVDLRHGFFSVPVLYDGGRGGYDTFVLDSTPNATIYHGGTGPGAAVTRVGSLRITESNLEPTTIVMAGGDLHFDASGAANHLSLDDDGDLSNGVNVVTGGGGFETTSFSGVDNVFLDGADAVSPGGDDTLQVVTVDGTAINGHALAKVVLNGNAGDDDLDFNNNVGDVPSLPASVQLDMFGGKGDDSMTVRDNLTSVNGAVVMDGGENSTTGTTGGSAICGNQSVTASPPDFDSAHFSDGNSAAPTTTYAVGFPTSLNDNTGFGGATISNTERFELDGSSNGVNTFNVGVTGADTGEAIYGGPLGDTATVAGTGASSYFLFGGSAGGGNDNVTLQHTGISSVSTLDGAAGNDTLTALADGSGSGLNLVGGSGADNATLQGSASGSVVDVALGPGPGDTFHETGTQNSTAICGDTAPTAVSLRSFTASRTDRGTALRWTTGGEVGALGFNLYRVQHGRQVKLNRTLILADGSLAGRAYAWLDRTSHRGGPATYRLQEVDLDGRLSWRAAAGVVFAR
jgi:hypothetical protein